MNEKFEVIFYTELHFGQLHFSKNYDGYILVFWVRLFCWQVLIILHCILYPVANNLYVLHCNQHCICLWQNIFMDWCNIEFKKKAAVVHILQVMHCFKSFKVSLIKDIPLHIFRKLLFYIWFVNSKTVFNT